VRAFEHGGRLLKLIDILNPDNEPGRLTLICRMGADQVGEHLPALIRAVETRGPPGGLVKRPDARQHHHLGQRYKTRPFELILKEVKHFFEVHAAEAAMAGGVHLEMTGTNVTECTGGARAISDADLNDRYHTFCDPRLNAEQAIEMAFLLAELLKEERVAANKPFAAAAGL
jgi:3-deoxy-7-phosphoheptulonate synthase